MKTLCRRIAMPEEVTEILLGWSPEPELAPVLDMLTCEDTWDLGLRRLREALGDDPDGFRELNCMLRCAMAAEARYSCLGISSQVYEDTFACFSRFVREYRESYGRYGFDRGFWTVRQISCKLFRIGQLEYELVRLDAQPVISLHIPSDASFRRDGLRASYLEARRLLGRAFPEYDGAPVFCQSWLLSPDLTGLLPRQSHILDFQRAFRITPLPDAADDVLQWVFKNPDLPPEQYPEDTTLQRNLKAFLLGGGIFRDAKGYLTEDPFL